MQKKRQVPTLNQQWRGRREGKACEPEELWKSRWLKKMVRVFLRPFVALVLGTAVQATLAVHEVAMMAGEDQCREREGGRAAGGRERGGRGMLAEGRSSTEKRTTVVIGAEERRETEGEGGQREGASGRGRERRERGLATEGDVGSGERRRERWRERRAGAVDGEEGGRGAGRRGRERRRAGGRGREF